MYFSLTLSRSCLFVFRWGKEMGISEQRGKRLISVEWRVTGLVQFPASEQQRGRAVFRTWWEPWDVLGRTILPMVQVWCGPRGAPRRRCFSAWRLHWLSLHAPCPSLTCACSFKIRRPSSSSSFEKLSHDRSQWIFKEPFLFFLLLWDMRKTKKKGWNYTFHPMIKYTSD